MAVLALRPSVAVSVLLHAGAFVGAAAWAGGPTAAPRAAVVLHFEALEVGAAVDAPDAPPVDVPERAVEPVLVEPPNLDRAPADEPLPDEDSPLEPPEEERSATPGPGPAAPPSATARVRASRPAPAAPSAPSRPVAVALPVPASAPAPSVASRAGAPQVSTFATASPTNRRPAYPAEALARGWTGVVWLVVDIGADGAVTHVTLERSSGHGVLDAAAVEAVWGWRYAPRIADGVPAPDRIRFPVRFETR